MRKRLCDLKKGEAVILGDGRPYWRVSKYKFSDGLRIFEIFNIFNIWGRV